MVLTRVFAVLSLELCQALTMEPHVLRTNKGILMIMNYWKIRFLSNKNDTAITGMRRQEKLNFFFFPQKRHVVCLALLVLCIKILSGRSKKVDKKFTCRNQNKITTHNLLLLCLHFNVVYLKTHYFVRMGNWNEFI